MKRLYKIFIVAGMMILAGACTDKFNEINIKPDAFTQDEVSAKYFITGPQYRLYAPDRYPYWRAHLIHMDRFAGHFCFGFKGSWWSDELGYSYSGGYTDASWDWLAGYIGGLDNFMKLVDTGGEFENEYMYAVGKIMRGLYFQMFTDVFGMITYTEATNPDITLPKLDEQAVIYEGLIGELNEAMATIGDAATTGVGVDDLGDNDLYCGGDLQKWKKLANTLKLRLAMRAYEAPGATFASAAITEALAAPLLETSADNVMMEKDNEISQWGSACYGDVWYNFGAGSDWTVGKTLIDALRNNNDPRLPKYAKPAKGGTIVIEAPTGPEAAFHWDRVNFVTGILDDAGVSYTYSDGLPADSTVTIVMPENVYYVGQPTRVNGKTNPYMGYGFFSTPAEEIIAKKNTTSIRSELIMSTAESYFLQAEAVAKGIAGGDDNALYQEGIRAAMELWGVGSGDIDTYIANEAIATLTGNNLEQKLEKIATQRWIVSYTDGFEAFAVVRDFGYPSELADGVTDFTIFGPGDINGVYPQRMQYGNSLKNNNTAEYEAALAIQGDDLMDTKLWWAK